MIPFVPLFALLCLVAKCATFEDLPLEVESRIVVENIIQYSEDYDDLKNSMLVCRKWKKIVSSYIESLNLDDLNDERVQRQLRRCMWTVHCRNFEPNYPILTVSPHGGIELDQRAYRRLPKGLKEFVSRCWAKKHHRTLPLLLSMLENLFISFSVYIGAIEMTGCPTQFFVDVLGLSSSAVLIIAAIIQLLPVVILGESDPLEEMIEHHIFWSNPTLVNSVVGNASLFLYMAIKIFKDLLVRLPESFTDIPMVPAMGSLIPPVVGLLGSIMIGVRAFNNPYTLIIIAILVALIDKFLA